LAAALIALSLGVVAAPARAATATASTPDGTFDLTVALGDAVLHQAPTRAGRPTGPLGFATAAGWFHATKVLARRTLADSGGEALTLATNDPLGRTMELRLHSDGGGVVTLAAQVAGAVGTADVTATGIGFAALPGERYLGFGERSNAIDQRGRDVESYVADGPYQPEENAAIALFVPPPGFRAREDATYFPIPWLLSTRGYGVLVDDDETSTYRLGTDDRDAWSVEVTAAHLHLRFFAGHTPADVVSLMSSRLGRQPPAATPAYFGPWFQPKGDEGALVRKLAGADVPSSVAQTYTHFLPCGDHQGHANALRARTGALHAAGYAVTTYFNPMICTGYRRFDEAAAQGALTRDALGNPALYRYTGSTQFLVGQFDFSAPTGNALFAGLLGEAVDLGFDGWMEDFGEYTPTDSVAADGTPGPAMHNRYPRLYHAAARAYAQRAPRPLIRFNRSGWTGAARESQIVWGGDPTTDWGFDGLASAVKQGLTMGLSGVSLWGSDIGGYFALGARKLSPELLQRWIEFGVASGVMRTEADGFNLPDHGPRPQVFDDSILPVWRRYAKLRTQLEPYLAGAEANYDATGMPIMRHLALTYPDDPRATARGDEYLFGADLLAAPVLTPGATTRSLYLPSGRWVDLWRSARFDNGPGALALGAPAVLDGGRDIELPAPIDELPLLVREGAIVPLTPPEVDTLSPYGAGTPGMVRLADRANRLTLLAWPHGGGSAALGAAGAGRVSTGEARGRWTLRFSQPRARRIALQASLRTLNRRITPRCIRVDGRVLPRSAWSYDVATGVLRGARC